MITSIKHQGCPLTLLVLASGCKYGMCILLKNVYSRKFSRGGWASGGPSVGWVLSCIGYMYILTLTTRGCMR
jgi:hypothetical protein